MNQSEIIKEFSNLPDEMKREYEIKISTFAMQKIKDKADIDTLTGLIHSYPPPRKNK